jgi:hypothetical protein
VRKLTIVPDFTTKGPRDGMTTESNKKNSRRETRSCCLTPESSSLVKVSYIANRKDHSPSSTHGAITIQVNDGNTFKVNGQRLKIFFKPSHDINQEIDEIDLISLNEFIANL